MCFDREYLSSHTNIQVLVCRVRHQLTPSRRNGGPGLASRRQQNLGCAQLSPDVASTLASCIMLFRFELVLP